MVRLKKGREAFEIVDGPDAGLKFERNKTYDQAPLGYEDRFEKITPVKVPEKSRDSKLPKPVVKPDLEPELKGDKS